MTETERKDAIAHRYYQTLAEWKLVTAEVLKELRAIERQEEAEIEALGDWWQTASQDERTAYYEAIEFEA